MPQHAPPSAKRERGSLAETRAEDLGKAVLEAVIERAPGEAGEEIDDIIIGCAMPEGEQGLNFARIMALYAGFPVSVPAITVNRFCASGLQSIAYAAERIISGAAEMIIAGGVESMSHVPMSGFKPSPHPRIVSEMPEVYMGMGLTAENVAEQFGISREDQDAFALSSHRKAAAAWADGKFREEITPLQIVRSGIGEDGKRFERSFIFQQDEGFRTDTSLEALAQLRPAFKQGGTVTAGNSSQMSDGAAAVLVMSKERAAALGLKPLATFRAYALAGVKPEIMGVGPVEAIRRRSA